MKKLLFSILLTIIWVSPLIFPICVFYFGESGGGCSSETITSTMSPNGLWQASVNQSVCDLGITSVVIADVAVAPAGRPDDRVVILGVGASDPSDWERISWVGSSELKIVVPFASSLKIDQRRIPGLVIGIELESRDPAQQDLFGREMNQ